MIITVEATYEGGLLKPVQPLPLKDHEKVQIVVHAPQQPILGDADEAERVVRRSSGIIGWTGDVETLRHVAEDPEFDPLESP